MQLTIKVENINPKGSVSVSDTEVREGVHMNTNTYIDPSKSEEIIPHNKILRLRMVVV